jgi:TatD-related deoxyribonuclease
MVDKLLYADGHAHANPVDGLGAARIAEKFREVGGWFIALVSLPPWHYGMKPRTVEDYARVFQLHSAQCREASGRGLRVSCFAGFHPAEVDRLVSAGMRPEEVLRLGLGVADLLERLCKEGIIDGLGEVGRQHYKTMPERVAIAEVVTMRVLEISRDYGCPVHLHLENAGEATVETIDHVARIIGVPKNRVLFHHASVRVAGHAAKLGYVATVPGKKEQLRAAFQRIGPVFIPESDYIDDPRRPCVSSCPWEIVERQQQLLAEREVTEEQLARVNIDNVVRFYGVEPP